MDNDDVPVGRVLSRREALALLGAAGAALLAGCSSEASSTATQGVPATTAAQPAAASATPGLNAEAATSVSVATAADATAAPAASLPNCVVSPAMTEGPYFVDEQLDRSDIRSDPATGQVRPGMPLELTINVRQISGGACTALGGALVDIWHCDAAGMYSDVSDGGFNTVGQKFLRGSQVSDASGVVKFTTIYPGWYSGRAVHIHFKVRSAANSGQTYEFTSQLFFDPAISAEVYAQAPYAEHGTTPDTPNSRDGIYQSGGDQLLVAVAKAGDGYSGTFDIGLNL
jgi:protocatechuate 3,4-dioxygenase beta subunit